MGRGPERLEHRPRTIELENRPRVVITGMGAVTNLGLNVPEFWKNLIDGKSGISAKDFPHPYTNVKVAGAIQEFSPETALSGIVEKRVVRRLSRPVQFAIAATHEALFSAGLLDEGKEAEDERRLMENVDETRIGTVVGTGIGGASDIIDAERTLVDGGRVNFANLLRSEPERVASAVSMTFKLKGPVLMVSAACATGNAAIIYGAQQILLGEADMMVVGGAEACIHEDTLALFESAQLAVTRNPDPRTASRPYNKKSDGFVMSEGAGIFILESLEHAKKRSAHIYAEIAGYGMNADASSDTAPSIDGQERVIGLAMRDASLPKEKPIYINTHGTSTPTGDPVELTAIRKVFPEQKKLISSTKSMIGHKVGAAGAVESIASIKALNSDIYPPTINLEDPIDEAEGLDLIPNEAREEKDIDDVLKTSFGFGGMNAAIRYRRYTGD